MAAEAERHPDVGRSKASSDVPPVLVADDDASAIELIRRFLEALRLVNPIIAVGRGDEAIRFLEAADPRPAFAILDMHMPGANGLEVLRWMRDHRPYAKVPVLVLTGSADLAVINETFDLGSVHYLVKPVGFEALEDILRRVELPWAVLEPVTAGAEP